MKDLILALPGAEELAEDLAARLRCGAGAVEVHHFPEGEDGVRLLSPVAGCRVLLAAHLDHPDDKTLPLLFAADAARDFGARRVGLVAPYLPYTRVRSPTGEAPCGRSYARLLRDAFDFVVTVQPQRDLHALFDDALEVASAVQPVAEWIAREVPDPVVVDVGGEGAPWIAAVAARLAVPCIVMEHPPGAAPRLPAQAAAGGRVPVLLQGIAASGASLAATAQVLRTAGFARAVAVAVHALLEDEDVEALHHAGVPRFVRCDTVPHTGPAIPLAGAIAAAVRERLAAPVCEHPA